MFMKRSKEEIIKCILELCKEPATVTRIVYQCNLNFRNGRTYITGMITSGLLSEVPDDRGTLYQSTPKGQNILGRMKALGDLLQPRNENL